MLCDSREHSSPCISLSGCSAPSVGVQLGTTCNKNNQTVHKSVTDTDGAGRRGIWHLLSGFCQFCDRALCT